MTTITKFVADVATIAGKASKLQETLQEMIKAAGDQKAFKVELYKAAKAKSDRAYAAVRQLYGRALKVLGIVTTEKRGTKSKTATKAANPKGEAKTGGMSDALALARVGELASAFLVADDQAIMSRLLAAIDHKRKSAIKAK